MGVGRERGTRESGWGGESLFTDHWSLPWSHKDGEVSIHLAEGGCL